MDWTCWVRGRYGSWRLGVVNQQFHLVKSVPRTRAGCQFVEQSKEDMAAPNGQASSDVCTCSIPNPANVQPSPRDKEGKRRERQKERSKRRAIGWLAELGTSASMIHSMLRLPTCSVLHESKSQCRRPSCRRLRSIDQLAVIDRRPLMVLSIVSCLVCSIFALLFPGLTYRGRLFDIPATQHFEVAAL